MDESSQQETYAKYVFSQCFAPLFDNIFILQNYLAPGNLSNLGFVACAEQLICRTPPLAASELTLH